MVLAKCASSQESWAVKKPKLTIHAISSADDAPIFEVDEAAHRPPLERHLQGAQYRQFERPSTDDVVFCSTGAP